MNFDNISIGRQKTVNDLARIEVYPIPCKFLKQIKFVSSDFSLPSSNAVFSSQLSAFAVIHDNPSFYKIQVNNPAFERSAANVVSEREAGFLKDGKLTIYLFFLPQLLEYFGFGLLVVLGIFLLAKLNRSKYSKPGA